MKLWLSGAIDRSQPLADFTEAKGRGLIDEYRELDERVRRLAIARAQMTASAASSRVRRRRSVREQAKWAFFGTKCRNGSESSRSEACAEIPHVLQALKPCLLMSPISVSTYLKPELFHFDLVVFDEASQLPTAEAVPAILRASQVVIASNATSCHRPHSSRLHLLPKEMRKMTRRPTTGQTPLESLLDDCVAIVPVFQESHLRWHYRSATSALSNSRIISFTITTSSLFRRRTLALPAKVSALSMWPRAYTTADVAA